MKNEKVLDQLISFDLAKLAKDKGFSNGSDLSYVNYKSDYVYDDDVNHRESHKNGEIRMSHGFIKNNDIGDYSSEYYDIYEITTQSIIQKWLRDNNIVIIPIPKLQYPDNAITDEYNILVYKNGKELEQYDGTYGGYEDALENGLEIGLNLI